MKHTIKVTMILVLLFLAAQLFGLVTINEYIEVIPKGTLVNGTPINKTVIEHPDTVVGETPEVEGPQGLIYILLAILAGTIVLLLIIKFKKTKIWKLWFFLAIFIAMAVAFGVYMNYYIALALAFILAWIKVYRPNVFVHNITEIIMYSGIAVLFVSFFNVLWAVVLLIAISVYDIYAVWRTKHMVKMAKFTMKAKIFAGLAVPYKRQGKQVKVSKIKPERLIKKRTAVLGGGDIAFPLIFSGVVMENLILAKEMAKLTALLETFIISFFVTVALSWLLVKAEKDKFYPAMPFLTAGCLIGYFVIIFIF